jgi:phage I-like protein
MSPEVLRLESAIDGMPGEVQIIPFGHHETEKGPFVLDEEGMAAVVKDFNARVNDMVIDYEHQSLTGGEAPAAGWIRRLYAVLPGDQREAPRPAGIWASVEWTERARQYLRNREYRYLSPVFLKKLSDGRVVRLLSAALTNQPAIDGMAPVVNRGGSSVVGGALRITHNRIDGKEVVMKKLLKLLGLPDTATEADAVEKVESLKEEVSALRSNVNEVFGLLGLKGSEALSEVTGTVMAMKQAAMQVEDLRDKLTAVEAALRRKGAEEVVAEAMNNGKVTPAQRDWALEYALRDPEGFRVFAAKAARVIHTGEVAGGKVPDDISHGAAGEVQRQVNRALGISEETFNRYGL